MLNSTNPQTVEQLNLKAVVEATGVKAVTLRAWERRYGIPNPGRTSGGQRVYTSADVEVINWLVEKRNAGLSISKAVDAWRSGAEALQESLDFKPSDHDDQFELIRSAYLTACISYDEQKAQTALDQAYARWHPQQVVSEILLKSMGQLGQLWHNGELAVQQEHFATTLTMRCIERLIAASPPPIRHERIVVGCAPNDYHSLSSLAITFLLRQHGFPVIHLGANVPAAELSEMLETIRPNLLILSAQRLNSVAQLPIVAQISAEHAVLFGFGGAIFNYIPDLQHHIAGHFLGNRLDDLALRVSQLVTDPPKLVVPQLPDSSYHLAYVEFEANRNQIENDVWRDMLAMGYTTRYLTAINRDLAEALGTLLRLGALHLLEPTIENLATLLISYRPMLDELPHYLRHYGRAVNLHLEHLHLARWFDELLTTA